MDRAYFFEGQSLGAEDLNENNDRLIANIKHRTIDFYSKGVIGARTASFVQNDLGNSIKILPFVAYTNDGERIYVYQEIGTLALDISEETTDILKKYRLRHQGDLADEDFGWTINETYHIYINYIEKGSRPRAQETTGVFYPTRVNSGFEFYAMPQSMSLDIDTTNMVRLCSLTYDGTQVSIQTTGYLQFATLDASKIYTSESAVSPIIYNPSIPVSIQDHIMALGSGIPSPKNPHGYTPEDLGFDAVSVQTHETRMHSAGLTGTTAARRSVSSAFYTLVNNRTNTWDNLILFNLAENEYLHYNGFWLNSLGFTDLNQVFLQFTYNNSVNPLPFPNGTYYIGLNPTTGNLIIGSNIASATNYTMDITVDSYGLDVITSVQLIPFESYEEANPFQIATFVWDNNISPKPATNIITDAFSTSNFTTKIDDRIFGGTSALDLTTSKTVTNTDVLTLPYQVRVNDLIVGNTQIDGSASLTPGYISGLLPVYGSTRSITITPGKCRDAANETDIILTRSLTKYLDVSWTQGGFGGVPVGGLSNADGTMTGPYIDPTNKQIGLHVFVIKNTSGDVDVAIDTDITGANVLTGTHYSHLRRICSLYISHTYGDGGTETATLTLPYTAIQEGSGVWIMYKPILQLTETMYTAGTLSWDKCGIPMGSVENSVVFRGKFNTAKMTTFNSFYSNYLVANNYVNGFMNFDIFIADQVLKTQSAFDFSTAEVYCLGYYDPRNS